MKQLFNIILFLLIQTSLTAQDTLLFKKNPLYERQIAFFEIYRQQQADVVMLGNSITHGVNWQELLSRKNISEQGIPSDILDGFIYRLNYVFRLRPKLCFVMGGINDIYSGYSPEAAFEKYKVIIGELKRNNIIPVIQSTLYVSPKWHSYQIKNPEVQKLNSLLRNYAEENGIEFMDLNAKLSVREALIDDYTYDGVHLNARAYKIWGNEVENILKKYRL